MVTKTNELPGTRAQVRHVRMSASKAREVLDLVRGLPVGEAADVLRFTERAASEVIARCLASAVANAQHNDELDPDTLYVSACYADEGPTLKRWRPRARGRATRIRKRTCHITIIVSRMGARELEQRRARTEAAVHDELIDLVKHAKGSVHAPKSVDVAESIPLSPLGKPDKKALRAQYWQDADRMVN